MFQKIANMTATYVNREHTNLHVREQINKKLQEAKAKPIVSLTEYHKRTRIAYLCKLIAAGDAEPGTAVTFDPVTLNALDHGKKRIGKPRLNWYQVTLADLWSETKKNIETVKYASLLDLTNATHRTAVETYAHAQIEETKKSTYPIEKRHTNTAG